MHDSTRRMICRLAFLALCLAPSGSLSAWIVYRATPVHAWRENACWTDAIYETTGLLAKVECIRHPTRSRTILESARTEEARDRLGRPLRGVRRAFRRDLR